MSPVAPMSRRAVTWVGLARPGLRFLVPLTVVMACHGAGPTARDDAALESGPAGNDVQSESNDNDEVRLTAEAIARAGITLAELDKRALSAGAAIAAEVQFDPSSTAHVGPLATGRIMRVAVELGQQVQRGDLLGVVSSGDVSSVRSRLVQARARLGAALTTWKRQQQLAREGIGAQRALVEAQTAVSELRAEVDGLEHQLSTLGSGDAGELRLASPIDGVVVAVRGSLGETATADQAVFVVTDPTRVWVRGDVPELEISRVSLGQRTRVRLHAYPELTLAGTITYIAPALDEHTRSLPVRVSLEAPDARLRSGMFGSVELMSGAHDARVLALPVDAVTTLEGQDVVFVAGDEPGLFRATAVGLGRRSGGFYEVRSGVAEGQRVAASGTFTLKSVLRANELSDGDTD